MSVLRRESAQLALVLLIALVARLAFVGWWQQSRINDPQQFEFPDSRGYWELGQRLAAGEPYEFGSPDRRVFRAPGYPLLLAAMFRVVGADVSPSSARWLGAAIGTLTVGATYWLARITLGRLVALLAAGIVAIYPEAIVTSALPLSDGPFCLWMLLQLIVWRYAANGVGSAVEIGPQPAVLQTTSTRRPGPAFAVAAGILAGVATLTRPSWLLFTPLVIAIWWFNASFDRRSRMLGATMLMALAITMLPWWVRNWQVTSRFVATTLQTGASLYDGLRPDADGSSDMRFVAKFEEQLRTFDAAHPPAPSDPPFEYRLDRLMRDEALSWAVDNPGRALQLAGVKLVRMWNVWPNEPTFRNGWVRLVVLGSYVPVVALAIYGAWLSRRRSFDVLLMLSPAVYLSLIHAVFIGSLRYRQPAMLTLAILAAAAIVDIWHVRAARATPEIDVRAPRR